MHMELMRTSLAKKHLQIIFISSEKSFSRFKFCVDAPTILTCMNLIDVLRDWEKEKKWKLIKKSGLISTFSFCFKEKGFVCWRLSVFDLLFHWFCFSSFSEKFGKMKAIKSAIGEHVHKSFSFMTAKNEFHSVVVYWKDGKAVSKNELPPKVANAVRFACISDTHCKTSQFVLEEEVSSFFFFSSFFFSLFCTQALDAWLRRHSACRRFYCQRKKTRKCFFFSSFLRCREQEQMRKPKSLVIFVVTWSARCSWLPEIVRRKHFACLFVFVCFSWKSEDDLTFDSSYYKDRGCVRFHQGKFQDGDPRKLLPPNVTYLQDSQSSFKVCSSWNCCHLTFSSGHLNLRISLATWILWLGVQFDAAFWRARQQMESDSKQHRSADHSRTSSRKSWRKLRGRIWCWMRTFDQENSWIQSIDSCESDCLVGLFVVVSEELQVCGHIHERWMRVISGFFFFFFPHVSSKLRMLLCWENNLDQCFICQLQLQADKSSNCVWHDQKLKFFSFKSEKSWYSSTEWWRTDPWWIFAKKKTYVTSPTRRKKPQHVTHFLNKVFLMSNCLMGVGKIPTTIEAMLS